MSRQEDVAIVTLPMDAEERALFDELKAVARVDSDANLVRLAVYKLALWYELDPPAERFAMRLNGSGSVMSAARALEAGTPHEPSLFDTQEVV